MGAGGSSRRFGSAPRAVAPSHGRTTMSDPNLPGSPPPPLPEDETPEARREREERDATVRVLKLWSRLPGPFPFITLAIIIVSVAVTVASAYAPQRTMELFTASGVEIWAERKWWGLFTSIFF